MSTVTKFLFEGAPVRGMLVRIEGDWRALLARREASGAWPEPVRRLLGELTAAAVLLRANLKFDGALVMQVFGDGPLKLAVAEVRPDEPAAAGRATAGEGGAADAPAAAAAGLAFRSTATVVGEVPADAQLAALVNAGGQGRCAITLDPQDASGVRRPYQGVVALHGDDGQPLQELAAVLEHYMLQSEQLDTRLVLAADDRVATGLLVQRMPVEGEGNLEGRGPGGAPTGGLASDSSAAREAALGDSEDFERIALLAATLTRAELLSLEPQAVLRRLFWEERVRVFPPERPRFACTCSRERVGGMLRGLGREEVDGIVEERGDVEVACEFCGQQYHFDAVDVAGIFLPGAQVLPGSRSLN